MSLDMSSVPTSHHYFNSYLEAISVYVMSYMMCLVHHYSRFACVLLLMKGYKEGC